MPPSPRRHGRYLLRLGVGDKLSVAHRVEDLLADPLAVQLLSALSLRGLTRTFAASVDELDRARDDLTAVLGWLTGPGLAALRALSFGPLVEEGLEPAMVHALAQDVINRAAIGVPLVLTLRHLLGAKLDTGAAWVRVQGNPPASRIA